MVLPSSPSFGVSLSKPKSMLKAVLPKGEELVLPAGLDVLELAGAVVLVAPGGSVGQVEAGRLVQD
jgi:hypothetical protein